MLIFYFCTAMLLSQAVKVSCSIDGAGQVDEHQNHDVVEELPVASGETLEVRPEMLMSAAVQRLLHEVRCEDVDPAATHAYNRTHNRHNR